MTIYASTQVKPYVYWLTHKTTGQFYIGYREANKLPADQDLPVYKTSSKKIKELGFENFDWQIIAEFFDADSAYDFEQSLIEEHLDSSLILNRYVHKVNFSRWKRSGPMPREAARKSALARTGRKASPEHCQKISKSRIGIQFSDETKAKMSAAAKNRLPVSNETRAKMSAVRKGKNTGPKSEEHRAALSKALKGFTHSQEMIEQIASKNRGKKRSDETRNKLAQLKLGKIGINNGIVNRMISKEELEVYLTQGWMLGRKS